ncbi:undecaprenyldiphospho-muramoylpentapeptide beta-N-acetylglucosaminyltransferase [Prochlorococcus sp. MIT 1341]|uniref:undecaprenyldiphospho-muramoylpentapeptide beta-N-acetylglucosaminyltransferase n=1 Tax=Prochlorococcus sp. MIT 1341 TaxID=3096221 RepID=UPI002A74B774|nr:undecaprenyldiphospho-muramoylpentapeptide beta-N-acetylglucosaminyltransferase [Prochlorococcus sp. MIT 1341]
MPKLLIAASGTGGHIYPALAVAKALPATWQCRWIGVPDRLEAKIIPTEYHLTTVSAGGLQNSFFHKLLRLLQALAVSLKIRRLIKKEKIQVVFTTGGYIAAPAILAARLCQIPVLLHESNVIPGKVTRFMGRFCKVVAIGLPDTARQIPRIKTILTGTPVRAEFYQIQPVPTWVPIGSGPLLIVIGGSQGAIGLNRMVRPLLPSLLEAGCRVVHITGNNDKEINHINHPNLIEKKFTEEVAGLLQNADLAISRAGAGSISELAICGTPSILVPFPNASDRHQDANASCVASFGGAVIVHQHKANEYSLRNNITYLLNPRLSTKGSKEDLLLTMSKQIRKLAVKDAEKRIVKLLEGLI